MRPLVRILCGSYLYGTNVEGSDQDFKVVFVPPAQKILLGGGDKITQSKSEGQDEEHLSLQAFLRLACEGQTNALDMLFAPELFRKNDLGWSEILAAREKFLSKQCKAFVGYCRQQASKYSVKADRLSAVEEIVQILGGAMEKTKILGEVSGLDQFVLANPYAEVVQIDNAQGKSIPHLSVCQTLIPMGAPLRIALATFREKLEKYGSRVKRTQEMGAKDWKALYHAVRVANEAIELLITKFITLPRPERNFLLSIRAGEIPYEEISDLLEQRLEELESAKAKSSLPEEPDYKLAENLVLEFYEREVKNS